MNTNGILDYLDSFVQENADLIDSFNFDELYEKLLRENMDEVIPYFTELLYGNNIDPLQYLDSVPPYFLSGIDSVNKITIPRKIKRIRSNAFYNCRNLESIDILGDVEYIGCDVFDNCYNLEQIKFPSALKGFDYQEWPYTLKYLDFSQVNTNLIMDFLIRTLNSISSSDDINILNITLVLPSNFIVDWDMLYAEYTRRFFRDINNHVFIKIGSKIYSGLDILKIIDGQKSRIPTLYRVGDLSGELSDRVLVAFMKQDTLEVTMRTKSMIPESRCALFFTSEKDAEDFMDRAGFDKVESGKYNTKRNGLSRIHKARISSNDKNFTLINTPFGECYVQSWKADKYIDPKYIIKKDCF